MSGGNFVFLHFNFHCPMPTEGPVLDGPIHVLGWKFSSLGRREQAVQAVESTVQNE
jgi:ABC-type histidine transport system ATPase subunit